MGKLAEDRPRATRTMPETLPKYPKDTLDYLAQHPDLAGIVPAMVQEARNEFGPDAEVFVSLHSDREIHDRCLTVCVRLPVYSPDVMDRIDRVSRPFDDALEQTTGDLLLTTDFRKPNPAHGV